MKLRGLYKLSVLVALMAAPGAAGRTPAPAQETPAYSFAIVVDSCTWKACGAEIAAYGEAVGDQGLRVLTMVDEWSAPEQVRTALHDAYLNENLEGAVFIGDIPVPMIRRAQHLCSAFKMQEDPEDMFNTSVPSDRFYDDFDLKFDYIASEDTLGFSYFYYNLRGDGPQEIASDIYTGRIKPTLDGEAGYAQVASYLEKLVRIKEESNVVDRILSYTGSGSFSNSLVAWKDESVTLQEQFPDAFRDADGARFYIYAMYPFPKDVIRKELAREDLDIALFHEHGVPDRQYLSDNPPVQGIGAYYEDAKRRLRSEVATQIRYGSSEEEAIEALKLKYDLDDSWFDGLHDPAVAAADSLYDLRTGIILEDIHEWNPDPLVTIFDACYNGDFREKDCVASSYIFGSGRSVVSLGNSVNVLQDKSSSDLLGMLSCGFSVGQLAQMTNILESHVIGDPTFCFAPSDPDAPKPDFHESDPGYWLSVLEDDSRCDMRGLALHKLYLLDYDGLSDLLLEVYEESDEYMLRLQAMHLSAHYADGNYEELLLKALDDPYEFIRRKAVYYAGRTGDMRFVEPVARMYLRDHTSKRIDFNLVSTAPFWGVDAVPDAVERLIAASDEVFDKEAVLEEMVGALRDGMSIPTSVMKTFETKENLMKSRFYVSVLRNMPYPFLTGKVLEYVADESLPLDLRVQLAEALGWYVRSGTRTEIIAGCREILETQGASIAPELEDELNKTINRLEEYSR